VSACAPDGNLPDALQGESHIRDIFYRMGLNDREIVALSGAHALGRCHTDRSGFSGPWSRAPTTFSNEYFKLMLDEEWTVKKWDGPKQYENATTGGDLMMLETDLALIKDTHFKRYVDAYAKDEKEFFNDFSESWTKLMELGVNFDKKIQTNLKQ
jgi:cytochrome c peroxidase